MTTASPTAECQLQTARLMQRTGSKDPTKACGLEGRPQMLPHARLPNTQLLQMYAGHSGQQHSQSPKSHLENFAL